VERLHAAGDAEEGIAAKKNEDRLGSAKPV
jgi:hypothetical protein